MRLFLLVLIILPACSPSLSSADLPAEPAATALAEPAPARFSAQTPTITQLAAPELIPTKTILAQNAPAVAVQPSILPAFRLCSPLSLHPLSELPQIIGDPYDPPPPGREERHHGIDFGYYHYRDRDSMQGEPIQAVLSGVVASALDDHYPYGNMVMIETQQALLPADVVNALGFSPGDSLYVLYAHMNTPPEVNLGETVESCQLLGEVGMTGNTELPHLHLETRLGPEGTAFKSMRFYDTRAKVEEMDAYKLWRTSGVFRHFDPMKLLSLPLEASPRLPAHP
ncbi:MAG TPA: M23 family metallopeptidase [Anaerolineales bacterium]|jgi:murein DD-endopeptidase MepM/ murein hydrolase activator NlpD|nr:M23 family metallopeptidase [Anaerolineales bacterium]